MSQLERQVRPTFTTLEVPVTRLSIVLVISRRRAAQRAARRGQLDESIAVRWFRRELDRTRWRYVVAGDMRIEVDETQGDLFVRNRHALRVELPVLLPPGLPFADVDHMSVGAGVTVVALPLMMPSPRP